MPIMIRSLIGLHYWRVNYWVFPAFATSRGGDYEGSGFMRWTYTLPDHFISVSHWIAKSMQDKLHIPAEKISVVYDGIALEKLNIHADGQNSGEPIRFPMKPLLLAWLVC